MGIRYFSYLCHLTVDGLIVGSPQKDAGILKLPPKSLPIPNTDPPAAINAHSPPEEPPGDRCGL